MSVKDRKSRYIKFLVYVFVIVLVNLAGATLFYRLDLTKNQIYSISDLSEEVVANLKEPLTIKVFFTKDLGAPYNTIEQTLRDLFDEYAVYNKKTFNYQFYDVSPDEGDITEEAKENRELAQSYGIYPAQLQIIEADQVKVQKAYMGLVMIHGDLIEKIPFVESTEGLEYQLTTMIQKMHNKTSALMNLPDKIHVTLFLSSSLESVAPYIRLSGLSDIPKKLEKVVENLNGKNFGKLKFQYFDPTRQPEAETKVKKYNLQSLKWPALSDISGNEIPEGHGSIGLVMEYAEKAVEIPVLNVTRIPILGTRYELVDMDTIEETMNETVESLIDINEDLGYLADHDTLTLNSLAPQGVQRQAQDAVSEFNTTVSQTYSIKEVRLKDGEIPSGINCLVIARPKERFSDYELFQIDQFLMKGNSLALFLDAFNEIQQANQRSMQFNQGPFYVPLNTGLEKLLNHYGVRIKKAYVLDKNCFTQRYRSQSGIEEIPVYFAPRIKNKNINHNINYLKNIKDLLALQLSPVELDEERIKEQGLEALRLFSSSEKSWEMSGRINLNPMFIQLPEPEEFKGGFPLAYVIKGEFGSYFTGKQLPEKPVEETEESDSETQQETAETKKEKRNDVDLSKITEEGAFISKGKPGQIFIIGTSSILRNDVFNWQNEGQNREREFPNKVFVMNVMDSLNQRESLALMRGKRQSYNPLDETAVGTRNILKTLNIAGLVVLVVLLGLLVWFRRNSRKKRIQLMFQR